MKDREGFLLKVCISLFVVCALLSLCLVVNSCSSTAKVEITKEVCNAADFR